MKEEDKQKIWNPRELYKVYDDTQNQTDEFFSYVDQITKYYGDTYLYPEDDPKPDDNGMYKINVDLKDLMEEWLDEIAYTTQHLSMAEVILIKNYLKAGKYDEEGKEFLNKIREKWINYNKNR